MRAVLARLAAVVVAGGLVFGAWQLRDTLYGDDTAEAGGSGVPAQPSGGTEQGSGPDTALVLGCPLGAELCAGLPDGLQATSASAWEQAQQLLGSSEGSQAPPMDAWLVPSAWAAMVAEVSTLQSNTPVVGEPLATFGRTPTVIVLPEERAQVLAAHCGGRIDWDCVGSSVGPWTDIGGQAGWGDLKPAHEPPTEALGLLTVAQAASDRLGDTSFTRRELEAAEFTSWLAGLERAATFEAPGGSLLRQLIETGASTIDVVGTTEADAAALVPLAPGRNMQLTVVWPSAPIVAELVLVPVAGRETAADEIAEALSGFQPEGWRASDQESPLIDGAPALDDVPPPPSGGALYALVETWQNLNLD